MLRFCYDFFAYVSATKDRLRKAPDDFTIILSTIKCRCFFSNVLEFSCDFLEISSLKSVLGPTYAIKLSHTIVRCDLYT